MHLYPHAEVLFAGKTKFEGSGESRMSASQDKKRPAPELLRAFKRAEVPITVGSDAHTSADIAWGIRDAYAYAAAAGYREIEVPHADGSWETMPLE